MAAKEKKRHSVTDINVMHRNVKNAVTYATTGTNAQHFNDNFVTL